MFVRFAVDEFVNPSDSVSLRFTVSDDAVGGLLEAAIDDVRVERVQCGNFKRGDCSGDGSVDALIDALFLLRYSFASGDKPPCLDAADVNDSGRVEGLLDALYLLRYGFLGGDAPPDPGPKTCGPDPDDDNDNEDCLETADVCL